MTFPVRRVLRWAAIVLALLLAVTTVAWTVANLVYSSRFESARRTLDEAGYAMSLPAIAPPELPRGENAAPFFQAAFALFLEPSEIESSWEGPPKDLRALSEEHRTKVRVWLERNREAFEMVVRACQRPRCRYERDYAQGYSILLPELSKIIGLSRALAARAAFQAEAGEFASSREAVRSMIHLSDSLRDEPILVSQLVRFVVADQALEAIARAVPAAATEAELKEWLALAPPERMFEGALERGLRGELGMAGDFLSGPMGEFWTMMGDRNGIPVWILRPVLKWDGVRYLHRMREMIDVSRKAYSEAREGLDRVAGRQPSDWRGVICGRLLPSLGPAFERQAAVQAAAAVVRAGLAAELELRATGVLPEQVTAADPFTGAPLKYDRESGTISSAGGRANQPILQWKIRGKAK